MTQSSLGPRPTPYPRSPHPDLTVIMAAPRRNAGHRRQVNRSPWRTAGLVVLAVLGGITLLLGMVGWVAVVVVVL